MEHQGYVIFVEVNMEEEVAPDIAFCRTCESRILNGKLIQEINQSNPASERFRTYTLGVDGISSNWNIFLNIINECDKYNIK